MSFPGGTLQIVQVRRDDTLATYKECAWIVQIHCEMDDPDKTVIELPQLSIMPELKLSSKVYFLLCGFLKGENGGKIHIDTYGGDLDQDTGDILFIPEANEEDMEYYDVRHIPFKLISGQDYIYIRWDQPLSLDIQVKP